MIVANIDEARRPTRRRSPLLGGAAAGGGAIGVSRPLTALDALAITSPTKSDATVLPFLDAAELLERGPRELYVGVGRIQDGGRPRGTGNGTDAEALAAPGEDIPQWIHDKALADGADDAAPHR
jgi:hypothetical protein